MPLLGAVESVRPDPVVIVTRDIDVLSELARFHCIGVHVSVTTLDSDLGGELEPRASRPPARLRAIREMSAAGIPVGVMVAPIIPGLTDHDVQRVAGEIRRLLAVPVPA